MSSSASSSTPWRSSSKAEPARSPTLRKMGLAGGFVTDLRTVLRGQGFRRLFAVRVSGQLGDGVFQVAMASYVFFSPERHATAPTAAQAFAVLLLPYSLVGPFAGVLLDRWRRRQVLLVANLVRAGLTVAVAARVADGRAGPALFATALVVLSMNRFILAGLSASVPHVVQRHELVMANAVFPTSGTVAAMTGTGIGFLMREATSSDAFPAACTAGLYLVAGLLALMLHRDLLGPDDDPARPSARVAVRRVVAGLLDGARHVHRRPAAAWGLTVIGAHRFFYGISTVAMILLSRNYFHSPDDADAGLATLATVLAVSGAAFFLGVASQGIKIVVDTLVQENVEDAYRGRVFSFYDVLFNVTFVAAALFAALTLPTSGKSYAVLAVISAGYAVTALVYSRVVSRLAREPLGT